MDPTTKATKTHPMRNVKWTVLVASLPAASCRTPLEETEKQGQNSSKKYTNPESVLAVQQHFHQLA